MNHFTGPQTGTVGHAQSGLILETTGGPQETGDFVQAQDDRNLARLVHMMQLDGDFGVFEGVSKEKLQCRDSGIEITAGDALFDQIQLVPSEVFGVGDVGRAT